MEANGWNVNTDVSYPQDYSAGCSPSDGSDTNNTWYGFSAGDTVGSISATLMGSGQLRLVYANCYSLDSHLDNNKVIVYLNDKIISSAGANETKKIIFKYRHGDNLKISEGFGIIKLHHIGWNCESK